MCVLRIKINKEKLIMDGKEAKAKFGSGINMPEKNVLHEGGTTTQPPMLNEASLHLISEKLDVLIKLVKQANASLKKIETNTADLGPIGPPVGG